MGKKEIYPCGTMTRRPTAVEPGRYRVSESQSPPPPMITDFATGDASAAAAGHRHGVAFLPIHHHSVRSRRTANSPRKVRAPPDGRTAHRTRRRDPPSPTNDCDTTPTVKSYPVYTVLVYRRVRRLWPTRARSRPPPSSHRLANNTGRK